MAEYRMLEIYADAPADMGRWVRVRVVVPAGWLGPKPPSPSGPGVEPRQGDEVHGAEPQDERGGGGGHVGRGRITVNFTGARIGGDWDES